MSYSSLKYGNDALSGPAFSTECFDDDDDDVVLRSLAICVVVVGRRERLLFFDGCADYGFQHG